MHTCLPITCLMWWYVCLRSVLYEHVSEQTVSPGAGADDRVGAPHSSTCHKRENCGMHTISNGRRWLQRSWWSSDCRLFRDMYQFAGKKSLAKRHVNELSFPQAD